MKRGMCLVARFTRLCRLPYFHLCLAAFLALSTAACSTTTASRRGAKTHKVARAKHGKSGQRAPARAASRSIDDSSFGLYDASTLNRAALHKGEQSRMAAALDSY